MFADPLNLVEFPALEVLRCTVYVVNSLSKALLFTLCFTIIDDLS